MNILSIDNYRAVVTQDPNTDMLRGELQPALRSAA
jgi:predicted HicB family RNase H-like nuclease